MKFDFKEFIKGIIVICSYFLIQVIYCMPFSYLLIKNKISESTVYFFVFIGMAITYIVYYRKSLLNDLKDLKKTYKTILKTTIKYWLIGFGLMLLSSMILTSLNIGIATNQEQNISLFKNAFTSDRFGLSFLMLILENFNFYLESGFQKSLDTSKFFQTF